MWRACASKRAFRIGVLCAILTPVAKVMAKRLKHTQNDPNKEHVTINSRLCADLPTHGISAPSTCNLTAQHHLSRIPLHQVFSRKLLNIEMVQAPSFKVNFAGIKLSKEPKKMLPDSDDDDKGHAMGSNERLFAFHLAEIDRILQSHPSPGGGH
ncbi:putative S-domain-2 5 [Hibiscus syriacus]|uniref:S-domain-2 5 n=1 Tax=Hibiscus syriacus TaxID=106335 RepID=A0A6A3ASN3_HIBSY|nr:putative S-domain-2 5 [Hibiscus syriacus]